MGITDVIFIGILDYIVGFQRLSCEKELCINIHLDFLIGKFECVM